MRIVYSQETFIQVGKTVTKRYRMNKVHVYQSALGDNVKLVNIKIGHYPFRDGGWAVNRSLNFRGWSPPFPARC